MEKYIKILSGSTWWMGAFIMGYYNSRSSGQLFHGIRRQNGQLLNIVFHQLLFSADGLMAPDVIQQVSVILNNMHMLTR